MRGPGLAWPASEGSPPLEYDLKIERHRVVQVAAQNDWARRAAPYFDYFDRRVPAGQITEVQVFYGEDGVVTSAGFIHHARRTQVAAGPDDLLGDVLDWLSGPGDHP